MEPTRILAILASLFIALAAMPFSMADGDVPASPGGGSGGSSPAVPSEPITTPTPSPLPPKQILDSRHYSATLKDGSSFTFTANLLEIKNANAKTPNAVFDFSYGICNSDATTSWCMGAASSEMLGKISGSMWKFPVAYSSANPTFSASLDKEYGRIWMQGYGWISVKATKSSEGIAIPAPSPAPVPAPSPNQPITIQSRQR